MKRAKRTVLFCIIFLLLPIICISCANPYLKEDKILPTLDIPSTPAVPADNENPDQASGNLVMGVTKYDTFDPLSTKNEMLRKYMTLVYESLVVPGKDLSPVPAIAKEWGTADGGVTWKFTIRDDVRYHDGAQCTVYDVKNTITWIQQNGGTYADCVKGITRFNVLSQFEIELILDKPDAFIPCKMIFPILKSEDLGNFTTPNGTGKYQYAGKNAAGNDTFTLNKTYRGPYPKIASFEIQNYDTVAALYGSDADVMLCFDDNVIRYAKREGYEVCGYTDGMLASLLPAAATPIEIRKFVSAALDRRTIVNAVVSGNGIEKLLPLLDGTYYKKNEDPFSQQPIGTPPATLNLIVNEKDKELVRLAGVIRSQLATYQTDCVVTAVKEEEFQNTVRGGKYDFALLNLNIGLWPDLYEMFATGGSFNYNGYSDAAMDSLLNSMRNAYQDSAAGVTDFTTFAAYAQGQIEKISEVAAETLPVIGLYSKNASVMLKDTVKGVNLFNFTYWNTLESFDSWYIENE